MIGDLLVVRLQGVLTAAEQHLVKTLPVEKGRDLLKQVRSQLVVVARPRLDAVVEDITGTKALSLHHDISTLTGEEIVVFTLAEAYPEVAARLENVYRQYVAEVKANNRPKCPAAAPRGRPVRRPAGKLTRISHGEMRE